MSVPHVATAIAAGAVAGLGSVPHCMGMCGPLVTGVCAGPREGVSYQVGRTVSYAAVGAASGGLLSLGTSPLSAELVSMLTSVIMALGLLWVALRLVRSTWPRAAARTELVRLRTKEGVSEHGAGKDGHAKGGERPAATPPRTTGRWARLARPLLRSPLLVGVVSAVLPCAALVNMGVLAAGSGSALTGALTGATFATVTGGGLATSVWAGSLLRETRAGSLVVAAVLVLGAGIVSVRAFPQLAGDVHGGAAPACHDDPSVSRAGGLP